MGRKLTQAVFLERAIKIHGNTYDYSLANHLAGYGCPGCAESSGEKVVAEKLKSMHIRYKREHRFPDCKHKRSLPFDFYLPEYHACIEFQGGQHYFAVKWYGGEVGFKATQHRDQIKLIYCQTNNIPLLIIPYTEVENVNTLVASFIESTSMLDTKYELLLASDE